MKTMCPPCYHHNGFVATYALGHMMYGYDHLYIYIYIYIYMYIYMYNSYDIWEVNSAKTQYLPTSFARRLLQGRRVFVTYVYN